MTLQPQSQQPNKKPVPKNYINKVLWKTLLYGFGWSIAFAFLLPQNSLESWQYAIFIGALTASLIGESALIEPILLYLAATINSLILLIPYFYYLKTSPQHWWLFWSLSLLGFINAALGFNLSMNLMVNINA